MQTTLPCSVWTALLIMSIICLVLPEPFFTHDYSNHVTHSFTMFKRWEAGPFLAIHFTIFEPFFFNLDSL